jgi:cytochrome c-type biogenesis protein CcmF
MIPIIGFTLLLLVFTLGIFLPIFNFYFFNKTKAKELQKLSFLICNLTLFCATLSQACLIYSFINSDYSVLNVYNNSHHLKPLIYKISGSWGNHEGSMLLLITILCLYNFAFNFFSKTNLEQKIITTSVQSFIIGLFAAFTAFASNPFATIFPSPIVGLGLNPILQDIGLAIHPPMLYMGYIGFALAFSFTIAALLREKIDHKFAQELKPWVFFSWGCLTLGIGLGAWWAYRELGWGGYWFWDPVENVSLMPWLCATALIHCLKILEKKEIFKIWTVFLSMLTFICCLLGIFLVRSGILTSVHSFAIDASRGFFIISLLSIIGGGAMLVFGNKISKIKSNKNKTAFLSKIGVILLNNYFLTLALFIVFLGTTYPIFSRSFFNQFISIGPSYYNGVFSILIIPFLLFLAISNHLNYEDNSKINHLINRRNVLILLASLAIAFLSFFFENKINILAITTLTLAIFSAFLTLKSKNLAMKLAHLGFCLSIIGIICTAHFGLTKEVNLKQGEVVKIKDYELKFEQLEYIAGKNFVSRQGDFSIFKNNQKIGELSPQLRYYPVSDQTTNETAIAHKFFGDIYLVIGNKDEQENYALRIYYKPFIYLIWFGCLLIAMSAVVVIVRLISRR